MSAEFNMIVYLCIVKHWYCTYDIFECIYDIEAYPICSMGLEYLPTFGLYLNVSKYSSFMGRIWVSSQTSRPQLIRP